MTVSLKELKNEALEPISYYMKMFDDTFSMVRHFHPYFELMYCQSGQFFFEVCETDERGKKRFINHKISAGEFIIVDAMVPHRIYNTKAMIYNVEFKVRNKAEYNPFGVFDVFSLNFSNFMRQGAWAQIAEEKNGYCILTDMESVEMSLRVFLDELFQGTNNFEQSFAAQSKLVTLFAEIGKCKTIGKPNGCLWYIRRTQEYIAHHFASNIKIDDIAEFIDISKAYLQRIFHEYTGTTILKTINSVRVERAKQLLMSTSLSVKQICGQSGFRNSQHFIYEFKNTVGVTPSDFRKRFRYKMYDHQATHHESGPFLEE